MKKLSQKTIAIVTIFMLLISLVLPAQSIKADAPDYRGILELLSLEDYPDLNAKFTYINSDIDAGWGELDASNGVELAHGNRHTGVNMTVNLKEYNEEEYEFIGWVVNNRDPVLMSESVEDIGLTSKTSYGIDGAFLYIGVSSEYGYEGVSTFSYDIIGQFYDELAGVDITLKPVFKSKTKEFIKYNLTVEESENGSVSKQHLTGNDYILKATPNNSYNYHFVGWKKQGEENTFSTENVLKITLQEDTTLIALFDTNSATFEFTDDAFVFVKTQLKGFNPNTSLPKNTTPLFAGQRVNLHFPYKVQGTGSLYVPYKLKVYEGTSTSGQLLAEYNNLDYNVGLTLTPSEKVSYASVTIDPLPASGTVTIEMKVNGEEPLIKTYRTDVQPADEKDLVYLTTPSAPYDISTEDTGPDILDVLSFVDEETGRMDVYASAFGGVLKLKGTNFEFIKGLNFTSATDSSMGRVIALGGTKEKLTAVAINHTDTTEYVTIYEYTVATDSWKELENAYLDSQKTGKTYNALVVDSDNIWTNYHHWDGTKWTEHNYKFSQFVNSRKGHYFASTSDGKAYEYKVKSSAWREIELGGNSKVSNITLNGTITFSGTDSVYTRDASGVITQAPLVNQVNTNNSWSQHFYNIDHRGEQYLFENSHWYGEVRTTGAEGHSVYKFDAKENKWKYQYIPAFYAPNEYPVGTNDYLEKKVRPTAVKTIYNLSDKASIYAGRGGAVYADFDETTITFNSNGGAEVAPLTAKINSQQNAPTPTKADEHFSGWYLDKELTKAYSLDYMPAKNLELFAKWVDKPVDLTQVKATANQTIEEAYKKYNKRDYDEDGWASLTKAKTEGLAAIAAMSSSEDEVKAATNKALAAMKDIKVNQNITVAVSMEKFTLGQGYIIEPTLVTVPRNTQASKVITDLLVKKYGAEPLPYKMTGNVTTNFYLAHVLDDGYKSDYKIPAYIMKAIEEDGSDFSLDNDEWLGEFDFFKNSGWMYAVNNAFPGVGAAGWTLENDQVMRWQYTIYGLGADLNANNEQWGAQSLIKTAQKDNLTWRVAEINSLSAEEKKAFLAKDDNQAHYDNAYKVLTNMESTQAEVDAVLKALGGTERVGEEVKVEMPEEAQVINDAIKALPENITLTSKDAVEKVRKQYEALDPTLKQWIWKDEMTILEAAEKKIALLIEKAAEVEKQIESLPTADKIKLTDEDKFYEVQTAYIGLSSDQQKLVSNAKKLIELMTKLEQLKDEQVTVEKVIEQITALPKVEDLKLTDEAAVTKVQAAYNKLTKDDQSKVTNAKTLTALVEKLAQLKASDNQKLASDVVTLINGLPSLSTVKLTNESTIQAVKTAYDNLSADAKKLVTNVFILNAVTAKLNELKQEETDKAAATKVTTLINNLPASASITLANKLNVSNARTNYNALTTTQKALILNLAKLIEAEAKITELEVNVEALVTEIAALPNAKDITSNHEKLVKILRDTYNSLATTQKAEVTNYAKLVEIEAALAKLQKADGDPKVDEEKVEVPQKLEEAIAAAKGIQSVKETNDSLIITSKANTTNVVLPNAFIEQIRTNKYETVQIENTNGVKIAISNSLVNDVLSKKSSLEVVVEQQKRGLEVALVEVLSNGIKRDLTTAGNYTKVTMPLNVLTGGTVASSNTIAKSEVKAIARLVDGEYKAVPHRIMNDEAIIYMNEAATYVPVNETITFKDIEKIGARADIEFLASRYVVYGTTESTYTPNKNITRAQFGVMIARALNLTATEETSIQDIKGKKYENEIQALYEAGITKVDNKFNPNAPLTREHAAAFMYRVMEYIQKEEVEAVKVSTFKDKASIGKEYMTAVATLQALEIMEGSNGKFSPKAHLTRAQMAKILRRTLEEVNMM